MKIVSFTANQYTGIIPEKVFLKSIMHLNYNRDKHYYVPGACSIVKWFNSRNIGRRKRDCLQSATQWRLDLAADILRD